MMSEGSVGDAQPDAAGRFRDLIERLPAVVYEAEPGPEGAFLYVSPQIEDLLGYTPDEWTADPSLWLSRLHIADREEALRLEREHELYARGGHTARMRSEYRMVHRNGEIVWVRDEARLIEAGPGRHLWRGVLVDITGSRLAPAPADDGARDAVRIVCRACGETTIADSEQPCGACGSEEVDATSLNATLAALAASRREVETLLEGIHRHLDGLYDILGAPGGRSGS